MKNFQKLLTSTFYNGQPNGLFEFNGQTTNRPHLVNSFLEDGDGNNCVANNEDISSQEEKGEIKKKGVQKRRVKKLKVKVQTEAQKFRLRISMN